MKLLKKGFNSQAHFGGMGLQTVMSAQDLIPPQKKLSTARDNIKNSEGRQEAETGNTFFMPVNIIEEGLAVKSV